MALANEEENTRWNQALQERPMNIYIGNIGPDVTEDDLSQAFREFGEVDTARLITDRYSGQSRGFGFVEMQNNTEAQAAIEGLNGKELKGRPIVVNEARPREQGRGGGGGGGGGGGRRW